MSSASARVTPAGGVVRPTLPRRRRLGSAVARYAPGLVLAALLLLLWETSATEGRRWLPPLTDVASTYWELITGQALTQDILPSLRRAVIGLGMGIAVGVVVGIPLGYFKWIDPWVRPLLELGRALPAVTLLPIGLLLIGPGDLMRILLIAFGCVFPVLWNAMDGARRVPEEFIHSARVAGLGRTALMSRVVLPATLPQIFAGIRVALGIALIMMVISELVAATDGLGALIFESQRRFDVDATYAGVLLLGTVGALLNAVFLQIDRMVLKWHHGWRRSTAD